jgi:hypothetical protein
VLASSRPLILDDIFKTVGKFVLQLEQLSVKGEFRFPALPPFVVLAAKSMDDIRSILADLTRCAYRTKLSISKLLDTPLFPYTGALMVVQALHVKGSPQVLKK